MKRREFVQWGVAVGAAATRTMSTLFAQAPAVRTGGVKPVVVSSANGNRLQERRSADGRRARVQPDDERRRGRARCGDCRRQHLRARSRRRQRRIRRAAQRRRRRPARFVLHARSAEARRRRGGAGRRANAVTGGAGGDGHDRSPSAGRQGRAGFRAQYGLQDRRRPQHGEVAGAVAGVEAAHRSRSLPGSEEARAGVVSTQACRWRARDSSIRSTSTARSTATASTPKATSAASRRRAAWRGRFRAASATRRSSAPDCTSTGRSAPPAPPAVARPTCTGCARS